MLKEKMVKILDEHDLMTLATLTSEGLPRARSVDFARDTENPFLLYFMTFKSSAKVQDLSHENRVFVVVDKEAKSMEELATICYLKASGMATPLTDESSIMNAMHHIISKYPYLKDLPGDPSMMAFYQVELKDIQMTDNTLGFGHTDHFTS